MKGYKVFNSGLTCRGFQFELGKTYKHEGEIRICNSGFHFCLKAQHCFSYYDFNPSNIVCEVEAIGKTQTHDEDSKVCTDEIFIIRQLTWDEVLVVANDGINNTGHSNSGYSNSGDRNSGDRNSGYSNSGDRNSGDRNSGDRNSGDSNSGNWNSGDRNSGDSNSGYRNAGAFCTDPNPKLILFDYVTDILVKDWENSEACRLMYNIEPAIWVPMSIMTDQEKKDHPKYEAPEGYLKTISMKEAWANFWGNLQEDKKQLFTSLPNFDTIKFEVITGIKTIK